jgi:outer membrane receptor protein involved in Fe transport
VPLAAAAAGEATIPEIVVTSQWRPASGAELPESATVLDARAIETGSIQHFEELTQRVPNLGYSGDGNRARYFQIRGTGELEQYEGAPNPSVGFLVDDIDFSGIGGIATRFDVDQVEVLRGPQGTRYGANALAGLIYVRTAEPSDTVEARVESILGSDATRSIGAVASGPVPGVESLDYRLAVQKYHDDGFRRDAYLNRGDTNHRDELTTRAKLRWQPGVAWRIDLTALYADLDDGYDEWAPDNNGFRTYSDRPGRDAQRSLAGSVRVTADPFDGFTLVSISSAAHSHINFDFDADWGNAQLWSPYTYDFSEANHRDRTTLSEELRLVSKPAGTLANCLDWVTGVYVLQLRENNGRRDLGIFSDGVTQPLTLDAATDSRYTATNVAVFAEAGAALGAGVRASLGLRGEHRSAEYSDSDSNRFAPGDLLWGGEFTLTEAAGDRLSLYQRIARGYKAGGFNPSLAGQNLSGSDLNITPAQILFGPESLWNFETGVHWRSAAGVLAADASVYWQRRHEMQVKVPIQLRAGDPSTFVFLTDNAERGELYGFELAIDWHIGSALALNGTLGVQHTEIQRFRTQPLFEGSAQAHAPPYSFSAGATYELAGGWNAHVDVAGRDSFLFDYDLSRGSDRRSLPYQVVNARVGREWGHWAAFLWARNLLDERYAVRGFYFGNEPPDFVPKRYLRFGDPRQFGVTVSFTY